MTDAVIHRVSEDVGGYAVRVLRASGSPRAYALAMTRWLIGHSRDHNTLLSLRGGSGAKDAAIHRVSEDVGGVVCSLPGSQLIATGLRPRDDKGEERESTCKLLTIVIARRERK